MTNYIPADKLIAEIERLKSVLADPLCSQGNILGPDWVAGGNKMLKEISSVITSLQQEQPEVDLEKEIEEHVIYMPHGEFASDNEIIEDMEWARKEFRHFYELGINAKKEENK